MMGTKTITMYVSDVDQTEIPEGQVYRLEVKHPDGSTQILDLSAENYKALNLDGKGKLLRKRGRKPGTKSGAGQPATGRRRASSARTDSGADSEAAESPAAVADA
jgi:hypothetical protein